MKYALPLRAAICVVAVIVLSMALQKPAEATECTASWYGPGFVGSRTASGEVFVGEADFTAASPYLPFGTIIYAENLESGAWGFFRVNDHGPYGGSRCLDFSQPYMVDYGVAPIYYTVIWSPY